MHVNPHQIPMILSSNCIPSLITLHHLYFIILVQATTIPHLGCCNDLLTVLQLPVLPFYNPFSSKQRVTIELKLDHISHCSKLSSGFPMTALKLLPQPTWLQALHHLSSFSLTHQAPTTQPFFVCQ